MSTDPSPKLNEISSPNLPIGFLNALDATVEESIPWVIDKLLAEGEQMLIFGPPKVGKSQFALQLAVSAALGCPFLNWRIAKRKRVLYLNFEMGKRFFMLRIARHFLYAESAAAGAEGRDENSENSEELQWLSSDGDVPPSRELRDKINFGIKDHLFFCGDIGGLENHTYSKNDSSAKKEESDDALVSYWQTIIEAIAPDLIVFDTLSKSHSINESDNNEIKKVLLQLRRISSLRNSDCEASDATDNRKSIAHIVIHHSRKNYGDDNSGFKDLSSDSIRGGSAIRAEADLILGISGRKSPTAEQPQAGRWINIESRNLPADLLKLTFDGWTFKMVEPHVEEKELVKQEIIIEQIRRAFVQEGVRGMGIESLQNKVTEGLKELKLDGKIVATRLKKIIREFAEKTGTDLKLRIKAGNEEETGRFPISRVKGDRFYWICDKSAWLEEEPLKSRIAEHQTAIARERVKSANKQKPHK